MICYFIFFASFATSAFSDECPRSNINNFYKELNCLPVHEHNSPCPTSFDCQQFENRNRSRCYYKRREYDVGERIPQDVAHPCFRHCTCVKEGEYPSFSCAVVECPEFFGPLPSRNCKLLYSKDSCCSVEEFCPDEDDRKKEVCHYGGESFYEGEMFYPEGNSCRKCYCKAGFNGSLEEPYCEDIKCNMELTAIGNGFNEDCVPVYYGKDGCCPIGWKCPKPSVAPKISTKGNGTGTTKRTCNFGNLKLKQFEAFADEEIRCECLVPPYLTCYRESRVEPE